MHAIQRSVFRHFILPGLALLGMAVAHAAWEQGWEPGGRVFEGLTH